MESLSSPLRCLTTHREEMLRDASEWSSDALLYRPRNDAWCGLEVLDHLTRVERSAALQIKRHSYSPRQRKAWTTPSQLVVLAIMRSSMRVKIPRGSEDIRPMRPKSLSSISSDWETAHANFAETIRNIDDDHDQMAVFRHPLAGWMTPAATVRFVNAHLQHHFHQWRRLRAAIA